MRLLLALLLPFTVFLLLGALSQGYSASYFK